MFIQPISMMRASQNAEPLTLTINTELGSEATFTIPCQNVGTFDAAVYWGDGTNNTITAFDSPDLVHTYAEHGVYEIQITGSFPNIYFADGGTRLMLTAMRGQHDWTSLRGAFSNCVNLATIDSSLWTLENGVADNLFVYANDPPPLSEAVLGSMTNVSNAWRGCSLTSFDATHLTNANDFNNAWNGNALTSFNGDGLASLTNPQGFCFLSAWTGGSNALDAASVQSILENIALSGANAPDSGKSIDISAVVDYHTAETDAAITTLKDRGWAVVINGVPL